MEKKFSWLFDFLPTSKAQKSYLFFLMAITGSDGNPLKAFFQLDHII